jgi:predicted nucleic acid-binding protein
MRRERSPCQTPRPTAAPLSGHHLNLPVRTLDALHLASVRFLGEHGKDVVLATYDERMTRAARAMGILLLEGLAP